MEIPQDKLAWSPPADWQKYVPPDPEDELLKPGEEVIIPSPYFVEYNFYLENHQGVPKVVPTKPDFSLDFEAIREGITEKTRAVLINSPNNPTGKVYSEGELKDLQK